MDKIVKQALKVDFHIHSYASHFNHDTIKGGTVDNYDTRSIMNLTLEFQGFLYALFLKIFKTFHKRFL